MMLLSLTTETNSADSPVTEDSQPTPKPGMWRWPLTLRAPRATLVDKKILLLSATGDFSQHEEWLRIDMSNIGLFLLYSPNSVVPSTKISLSIHTLLGGPFEPKRGQQSVFCQLPSVASAITSSS